MKNEQKDKISMRSRAEPFEKGTRGRVAIVWLKSATVLGVASLAEWSNASSTSRAY